jgi:hypothetical protein
VRLDDEPALSAVDSEGDLDVDTSSGPIPTRSAMVESDAPTGLTNTTL